MDSGVWIRGFGFEVVGSRLWVQGNRGCGFEVVGSRLWVRGEKGFL